MKKIIFINLITILILTVFLEFSVRILNIVGLQGADKNFFQSDNNITLNKPNVTLKVGGKYAKTDEHGFRIPLSKYNFNKSTSSTLILGDSVSFGFGAREKDTFIGTLRNKLNTNLLNASVIGHNLESYLYLLKKYNEELDKEYNKVYTRGFEGTY